ncbi:DUF4349 domain-containing protein [Acinetobacter piscicola]|uniref:DUF4349 domain-containing protein n=1 Tax=Acinetobacter piscicola TaxID=2006115 RepID=UPI001020CC25|nr:DUF4349 domain-containing protein [Acinetobacter piscicola]RYL27110.1 DUF4349 domain-containing protein [Acinetobacter piscicola]
MKNNFLIITLSCLCLTACSKKQEAEPSGNEAQENSIHAASNNQLDTSTTPQAQTTPITTQKPETILNPEANTVDTTRQMVREASVNFSAQDVVKTTLVIEQLGLKMGGFIEHKNVNYTVLEAKSQNISEGKVKIFEKIRPEADLIIRIPSENAATFVNQLLPLMYFFNQQQYSAKRYELKLLEEKVQQSQISTTAQSNAQLNEISRLTQLEIQDRIHFSTIHLNIDQPTIVRERIDVNLNDIAQLNGDHFGNRIRYAIQFGWQFLLDFLILLISIWPLYLFILIGFFLYKIIQPMINKIVK